MARRKKSWAKRFMMVGLVALATYGGWILYKSHEDVVNSAVGDTVDKVKGVGEALRK